MPADPVALLRLRALVLLLVCVVACAVMLNGSQARLPLVRARAIERDRANALYKLRNLLPHSFRRRYGVSPEAFDKMLQDVGPYLRNRKRKRGSAPNGTIPVELKLACGLRFLRGASYLDVADAVPVRVGECACKCIFLCPTPRCERVLVHAQRFELPLCASDDMPAHKPVRTPQVDCVQCHLGDGLGDLPGVQAAHDGRHRGLPPKNATRRTCSCAGRGETRSWVVWGRSTGGPAASNHL